jgi:hypothetical protein
MGDTRNIEINVNEVDGKDVNCIYFIQDTFISLPFSYKKANFLSS